MTATMVSATMRFRTKLRASFRSYAMLIAVMYEVIAPVVDQSASTAPTAVMTTP